jgi:hypothetical protein
MTPVSFNLQVADIDHLFTGDNIEPGERHHQDANDNQNDSYILLIHGFAFRMEFCFRLCTKNRSNPAGRIRPPGLRHGLLWVLSSPEPRANSERKNKNIGD